MTDSQRLDWLERIPSRFHDVYWRMMKEGETARNAIDKIAQMQADVDPTPPLGTKLP